MSVPATTMQVFVLNRVVYADVRCTHCGRLLFRWHPAGHAMINVKCPRCGVLDTVQLSTG